MSKTSIAPPKPLSPEILGERFFYEEFCPNCDDGCLKEKYCEGCDDVLCIGCWEEHNENASCHVGR